MVSLKEETIIPAPPSKVWPQMSDPEIVVSCISGAEFYNFRARNIKPGQAIHGRADLAVTASGFGLRSATVIQMGKIPALFAEHECANTATFWDVQSDDPIPSRAYRRIHCGEA
jgi:ligand-binding SRPBCC domain-containing protein